MINKGTSTFLITLLSLQLFSCATKPESTPTTAFPTSTQMPAAATSIIPTSTLEPEQVINQIILQEENTSSKYQIQLFPSSELEDNRIGMFAGGLTGGGWKPGEPWDYPWFVGRINGEGVTRFRVSIDNLDAGSPDLDWSIPQYTIDPSHDALISQLAEQGIKITYVLTFWDKDTWSGGAGAPCPRFKDQAEIDRYLNWAGTVAAHFKGRVQNYEIWNEPNRQVCPQWIEPTDYVNLVKQAAPVIRSADPQAKIVVGATSYLGEMDSQEYLFQILNSEIMPLVDVISWHPMYGTSPEFDSEYYSTYSDLVQNIQETARAHGFTGTFEADELTWFTLNGTNWDGWSKRYSDTVAAKYTTREILMHLGNDIAVGLSSAMLFDANWVATPAAVHNISTVLAGATTADMRVELTTAAANVVSYTFSLPGGDALVVFWSDVKASDNNQGMSAILTIPGLIATSVSGIDVMNGFEQSLIYTTESESLIIRNLLIKDYPILILLKGTQ